MGVVKPYLPELDPPVQFDKSRIPKLNTFDFNSTSVWHRCLGAQQHYSFFEHLENNKLGGTTSTAGTIITRGWTYI
jgi:hypothetical protein